MTSPLPPIGPDTEAWWDATREQRLTVQRCRDCAHAQLYPRPLCTACHGRQVELVEASGTGSVYSFSVVHRSPDPDTWPVPYVVALVRLEEGPQLVTNIVGASPEALRCELPVRVEWRPLEDGRHLPLFTPIELPYGDETWTSP